MFGDLCRVASGLRRVNRNRVGPEGETFVSTTQPHQPVVVVTGASGGIGRASALAFARCGAKVALLARGKAGLDAAAEQVRELVGTALPIPTDVAEHEQVEAAADRVEAELGPIDTWAGRAPDVAARCGRWPVPAGRPARPANASPIAVTISISGTVRRP
jgi:NAD(P)-dependent dehydrogenase (short-subunit alcohol dehydrogenase family)